ncbi:oxidoreductase [Phlyctema vagabunda]|uniref:Oxidoreductase n=1 Tax=Phlyctema vagabunda TaxID=108571 RepID=A0ABR4PD45_9HELO
MSGFMSGMSESKPAILCLHGGGTSGMIFNFQTMRIRRELDSVFDFVFIDAPFPSKPGPGVVPVFEDCGPFFTWMRPGQTDGILAEETRTLLKKTMNKQVARTGRPFVGVLGFSQGTKVASGLLLQQQWDLEAKDPKRKPTNFHFGVSLMGAPPPYTATPKPAAAYSEMITIPTVQVVGLRDSIRDWSNVLYTDYFDEDEVTYMELDAGHHLPDGKHQQDSAKIAKAILDLWYNS